VSFSAYPSYRDSGVEWLGEVPTHWVLKRLAHYFDERRTKVSDKDYPPLSVTKNGIVPQLETAAKTDDGDNRKLVLAGDFVINSRSDRKGSSGLSALEGSVSLINTVLHPGSEIDGRFAHHLFRSISFQEEYYRFGKGIVADLWSTNFSEMRNILLAVPPLEEQTTIAAFLGRETAKIDALVEDQRRLIELLKEKRQAVISHAVTKGLDPMVPMKDSGVEWLGDVPAHWSLCKLKHVIKPEDGIQMGPFGGMLTELAHDLTGFKLYGQENTISGDFERGRRWLRQDQFEELWRYQLLPGDLVLTRKGSLGGCRQVPEGITPGIADSDTIRVRLEPQKIGTMFAQILLRDAVYIATQVDLTKRGAILSGLNTEVVANLRFALPPFDEQERIVAHVDALDRMICRLVESAEAAISLLQERRAALISAAVTGKIDVRDIAGRKAKAA
jgi:type I restriction enzyme S subunit